MAVKEIWPFKGQGASPLSLLSLRTIIAKILIHHKVYRETIPNMHKLVRLVLFSVSFTTVFARNDTILHGWHSESHERGTSSILWGCLATIFICTWSVLHLDVPRRSASDLERFTVKVGETLKAIIAPELVLADAIADTLSSRILQKRMNRRADRQQGREVWSLTHVRFMLAKGFVKDTENDDVWDPPENPWELTIIPQKPTISKQELNSRGTTDWIANTLAVFQISWFGAQLLVRRIQHLHITAMEILTLAFIVCSIFTFILCWPEPQNVAYPIVLLPLEETAPERPDNTSPKVPLDTASEDSPPIQPCLRKEEDRSNNASHSLEHSPPDGPRALDRSEEVQSRASSLSESLDRVGTISELLFALAGGVFGGVHCLAWNSTFPTPKERLAWRVCSVAITALPIIVMPSILVIEIVLARRKEKAVIGYGLLAFSMPYILARLTLIALALASLRAVPADVFQTTDWNNIIPHVGL